MKQNLEHEAIFQLFRKWEDEELTTEEATSRLVALGYLKKDLWEIQKAECGALFRRFRSRCSQNKEIQMSWVNLSVTDEEGKKSHVWRRFKRLNNDGLEQFFRQEDDRIESQHCRYYEYFDSMSARKQQMIIDRIGVENMPSRPRQPMLAGFEEE
jgi:hypothetical protein